MGQTHNRKRTRSRPRSRGSNLFYQHTASTTSPLYYAYPPPLYTCSPMPATIMPSNFTTPEDPKTRGQYQPVVATKVDDLAISKIGEEEELPATKRQRMFGDDTGDEDGGLCGRMVQVVLDLFDGVDYEDP